MKCLPSTKLPLANGCVLHDWHAEILAIRAFNRFLLDQLELLLKSPSPSSDFIRRRHPDELLTTTTTEAPPEHQPPFTIKEDVQIYMYCSEAPCGDASMELIMDLQEDATPWTSPAPVISSTPATSPSQSTPTSGLRGRSHFSHLGTLRYKPSRPDAPPTTSKSCTDKLTLIQATSLLSSLTSTLISPRNAYLTSLILPSSQLVPSACARAFRTRMTHVTDDVVSGWTGGYTWRPFEVRGTSREFSFSRRSTGAGEKAIPSNISAVYTPAWQETLIGGVLQGRKQFDVRGASRVCRKGMWGMAGRVAMGLGVGVVREALSTKGKVGGGYAAVKESGVLSARRKVKGDVRKGVLGGWVRGVGDDGFGIE
ncbi:tRNA-specific adenosine deaminase, partial [Periconia macrospinosa]